MRRLLLLVGVALPGLLHAQPVPYGLSVDRDNVQTQQPVKVVVNFEAASRWCGLRVDLGDGDVRDILVDTFPLTLTKQYPAPGRYALRAQGRLMLRGLTSALGCAGSARAVTVVVGEGGGERQKRDAEMNREQQKRDAEMDREQQKRDAETAREQQKRDAELARERGKRDREDRPEPPNRGSGVAGVPAPVPAATPPRTPAPASSKPRDGTLKVF